MNKNRYGRCGGDMGEVSIVIAIHRFWMKLCELMKDCVIQFHKVEVQNKNSLENCVQKFGDILMTLEI